MCLCCLCNQEENQIGELVVFVRQRGGEQLLFLSGYFSCESIPQLGLQHSIINSFPSSAGVSWALWLKSGNEQKDEQRDHKQSSFIGVSFNDRLLPGQHGKPGEESVLWKKLSFFSMSRGREEAWVISIWSCISVSFASSYISITEFVVGTLKWMQGLERAQISPDSPCSRNDCSEKATKLMKHPP